MSTRNSKYGFIYMIQNKVTGRIYIGSTDRLLKTRWLEHKKRLRNGQHVNRELQVDYDDIGLSKFLFRLVEKCDKARTDEREQYWFNYYSNPVNNPNGIYNTGTNTDTVFKGRTHSDETRKKIGEAVKRTLARRKETREE